MRSFWTTADLRSQGLSPAEVRRRIRTGERFRIRPGWFASPSADPDLVRAVRLGGFATAHTASRALGLWTPPDETGAAVRHRRPRLPILHVAVPSTAAFQNLRDPDSGLSPFVPRADVVLHWTKPALLAGETGSGRAELLLVLEHLFRCEIPERALAVVDSALHQRVLHVRDLHVLAARLPAHLRPVLFAADGRAESGIETIARCRLRGLGLQIQVQPTLEGVGRVDLLVEGRVIVECDGREWHDDDEAFERDRTRDLSATLVRYRTVRCSWFQVLYRWQEVEAAVLAALARS